LASLGLVWGPQEKLGHEHEHALEVAMPKATPSFWQHLLFIFSCQQVNATVPSSKSSLKAFNHIWLIVSKDATLAIHSSNVRRMQEHFKKNTNFGQSQWLEMDQFAQ
jgi:hypothetical protein